MNFVSEFLKSKNIDKDSVAKVRVLSFPLSNFNRIEFREIETRKIVWHRSFAKLNPHEISQAAHS